MFFNKLDQLGKPFARGRIFATGGSGGGNVALMANKLAPRTFACIIDCSGRSKLSADIAFGLPGGSRLNARYSQDPASPHYLTMDAQEIRFVGHPNHLLKIPHPDYHDGVYKREAEKRGMIIVCPNGRGTTEYRGLGENDVLTEIEQLDRQFLVDRDRMVCLLEILEDNLREPKHEDEFLLQVSGCRYEFDREQAQGERIVKSDIELDRTYTVVCEYHMLNRGDTRFLPGRIGKLPCKDLDITNVTAAWRSIANNGGRIEGKLDGRVRDITPKL